MNEPAFWNELGKIYLRLDAIDDAVVAFSRAVDVDNPQEVHFRNLALAYFKRGENLEAISSYLKFIYLTSSREEKIAAWNQVGDTYRRMDDYENAISAYKKAAELSHSGIEPAGRRTPTPGGLLDLPLGDAQESRDAPPEQPPALLPDPVGPTPTVSKTPVPATGPAAEPAPPFWEAAKPGPTGPVSVGQPGLAGQLFGKSIVSVPSPTARENITPEIVDPVSGSGPRQDLAEMRRLAHERATYRKLTQISPNDDLAWQGLGRSCRDLGFYDDAVSAFQQAITLMPHDEGYLYDLGLVYVAQKRYEEAVDAFLKVIELNPGYALAHCALAGCYRRLGRNAGADEHMQIARPMMDLEKEYNRACFEAMCGHVDAAIALLRIALESKQITMAWVTSDPDLEFVREDPRFRALVADYAPALEKEWS